MMHSTMKNKRALQTLLAVCFWLAVWQIAAMAMQQEFLLPGSDDQGYSHALYKCPAISGVFHQKKGHPILPDFVLTDQKQ